jgi:hypothetical protein
MMSLTASIMSGKDGKKVCAPSINEASSTFPLAEVSFSVSPMEVCSGKRKDKELNWRVNRSLKFSFEGILLLWKFMGE